MKKPKVMRWILGVCTVSLWGNAGVAASVNQHGEAQVEWIRSKGGFFSPKLEFRLLDESDPDSGSGVFTTQDIAEDEKLMVIPRSCIIASEGSDDICGTARNLMEQVKLGDKSDYAPYVNFVMDAKQQGQVPSAWSEAGKELLQTIVGVELPPEDVTGRTFEQECGNSGESVDEEVFLAVLRRSSVGPLLPVFDMFNHRNGRWFNVESISAHDEDNDTTVIARRDIKAGEQLYLSYNECEDCDDSLTYVLQDILQDYGIVEQYPRRWRFRIHGEDLVFELDEHPEKNGLQLFWLLNEPSSFQKKYLRGHLTRLRGLREHVYEQVKHLESSHERSVSIDFYEAFVTALDYALLYSDMEGEAEQEDFIVSDDADPETCANPTISHEYDELEEPDYFVEFNDSPCSFNYNSDSYENIDVSESQYNEISFAYSQDNKDTCLWLNNHMQACASFRPHYHELVVHYPARYLDEVKRVAFIGGGDNMIVHEILKYPSLELVVGLELDHNVVRKSFKNLGTQPHWDNEKVQWWYGDGSKSIVMLPEGYYGSFDLVILDLQTEVVEMLKVAGDRDMMDAALLLLKPDGVIARNEDWEFGSNNAFTKYAVDLFYVDVPLICHQGITLGSNSVDFLTHSQKDHKIEAKFLEPVGENEDRFDFWYNYRKNSTRAEKACKEWPEELSSSPGVLLILEAEEASVPLNSPPSMEAAVRNFLRNEGLDLISAAVSPFDEEGWYEIVFILQEGYAVARVWPERRYCGFDLLLWNSFDKLDAAKKALVAAVGSKTSSSYRLVIGDMFGAPKEDKRNFGPHALDACKHPVDAEHHMDLGGDSPTEQIAVNTILSESTSMMQGTKNYVAVICGEQSKPCSSQTALKNKDTIAKVIPLWTCAGLSTSAADAEDVSNLFNCEIATLRSLEDFVNANGKVSGIVVDPDAPRAMGRVIHKILSKKLIRRDVLAEDYVVLMATPGPSESWRRALLDRFRTDIAAFDPAYRAEVFFNSSTTSVELGVFSSGDSSFFSHLVDTIARAEQKSGFVSDVQTITNGINNYVADFEPSKTFTVDDYDSSSALEQWRSQEQVSDQTIFQFAMKASQSPPSTNQVRESLNAALLEMEFDENDLDLNVRYYGKDGCIIVAFWPNGSSVLLWDGESRIVVNLFTDIGKGAGFEKSFLRAFPFLEITSVDVLPRGLGRIVNHKKEVGSQDPHWA